MTFQAGKLVVAGQGEMGPGNHDFALARYILTDGTLDMTLDGDGIKMQDIGERTAGAKSVAIQRDDKIVVAGSAYNGVHDVIAVSRYNVNGSLDTAFGDLGKVTADPTAATARANAVRTQADGKIVVAGEATAGAASDFVVLRYQTNGRPDSTFAGTGLVTTPIGTGSDVANAIALQGDGKIVVAGTTRTANNGDFAVVRYHANGSLDLSFDGDGKAVTAIATGEDQASAVQVQSDGKIVVAGQGTIALPDFALVRYNTNGTLDTSFGSFGRVATDFGGSHDAAFGMVIQPNGRIIAAGLAILGGVTVDIALARYLTNGILDTSFDGDGRVTTSVGLASDNAFAVALQSDGKILITGGSTIGANSEVILVRYNPDGSLDTTYGNGGKVVIDVATGGEDTGYGITFDSIGRAIVAGAASDLFGVIRLHGDPLLKLLSIARIPNGPAAIEGLGIPNRLHTVEGSSNLNAGSFVPLGPVTPNASGQWHFDDAGASALNRRFYRLVAP
jgi:uncharacterized delta-60 repeat protein